ncbi:hypothetical protein [Pseudonocardia ailaonensis]
MTDTPTPALDRLLQLLERPDPLADVDFDLEAAQLDAVRERFADHRARIVLVDKRATDTGIDSVESLADVVPLLFSHTAYKSYPESFVTAGRWDRLLAWLQTLSAVPVGHIDVSGVTDVDGFVERLDAAGSHLLTSSGTSGKPSFLQQSDLDVERGAQILTALWGSPPRIPRSREHRVVQLGPARGPARLVYAHRAKSDAWSRPGASHAFEDEPLRLSEIMAVAKLRKRVAAGEATPGELADFESEAAVRRIRMDKALHDLVDVILENRGEPMLLTGLWRQLWDLVEIARERGIPDGTFHPDSVVGGAGGLKGAVLPEDYEAQTRAFFAPARFVKVYGCSELASSSPICEAGRYHVPPTLVLLMLSDDGETLLPRHAGPVTGRVGFFDPALDSRWGGLVTGDRATADFGRCECGRPGPTIEDSVVRYSELGQGDDDRLLCSGTIDAYIRGLVRE